MSMTVPANDNEPIETIDSGVKRKWIQNHQIAVYSVEHISVANMVNWSEAVVETLKNWDTSRSYLALHDLSNTGVSLPYLFLSDLDVLNVGVTTTGRRKIETLIETTPTLHIRVAVVLSGSLSGRIAEIRKRSTGAILPRLEHKSFFSRDLALKWLMESLTQAGN
jgi:hypothetical protein